MDIEVDEQLYLPKLGDSAISTTFGKTKVSFVMLLIFIIAIYIVIFSFLNGINTTNSVGGNYVVLLIEILLWLILIYVVYINIKKYNNDNIDFQAKMENLFNTKISELTVNADTNKKKDDDSVQCEESDDGKEVFHIANNNLLLMKHETYATNIIHD